MLNVRAPFPEAGSYALIVGHSAELVRIHQHDSAAGTVLISYPRRHGASGTGTVPLSALQDGTPLTAAEAIEIDQLGRELGGKPARLRNQAQRDAHQAKRARHDALRLRRIYSDHLNDELRKAGLDRNAA